jgi:hypothetical protein
MGVLQVVLQVVLQFPVQKLSQLQFQEAQAKAQGSAPFWGQSRLPSPVHNRPGASFKKPSN